MDNINHIYVSKENGQVKSIAEALDEVKRLRAEQPEKAVEVNIAAGSYSASALRMTAEHSGTESAPVTFKAEGKVVFSGAFELDTAKFKAVSGEVKERLKPEAREHVLMFNLKEEGITKDDIGPFMSSDKNALKYEGYKAGGNAELFWNEKRLTLSRYPNEGFVEIQGIKDMGVVKRENGGKHNPAWDLPAPRGGTIYIDDETANEARLWREPEKVWCKGYYYIDWVCTASPIDWIDTDEKTLKFLFSTPYGYRKGGTFYFYNILEELDMPGEYYIDRENQILYVWPPEECDRAILTLKNDVLIEADGIESVIFDGIMFEGSRNDLVKINGNDIEFRNCRFVDTASNALIIDGMHNRVSGGEVAYLGKGGIKMTGGDRKTLTHSENVIENCLIHDFSQLTRVYTPGIEVDGCGAIVRHNELYNSPHMAITHPGNEHIIEYNYLHEVTTESIDAGAICTGGDAAAHGTIERFNYLENIGTKEYPSCAIYWDNTHSGQTAFGNVFRNVPGKSIMIGGGRENVVRNNISIGSEYAVQYDQRLRDGALSGGWYGNQIGAYMNSSKAMPVTEEPWASRYPHIKELKDDIDDTENICFAANPAYAVVENNVFVMTSDYGIALDEYVVKMGTVRNNIVFNSEEECLKDKKFTLTDEAKKLLPEFVEIPFEKIGIEKE